MRAFAALFAELDASTATTAKVDALVRYYAAATAAGRDADAAWATYFLAGGKPRAVVNARALREFALAASGLPDWLFEESYQAVGDLAETIAHLLPPPSRRTALGLADWVEARLLPLRGLAPAEVLARLRDYADELDDTERFLLIKLIGGGFRVGVSKLLVTRALAQHAGIDAKRVAQRLIGYTDIAALPTAARFGALVAADDDAGPDARGGTPYPFFLAHQLAVPLAQFDAALGAPADWIVEWKYDGIRGQLVRRDGQCWLWSRGEELVTERFPEIAQAALHLPDGTVLDGEVLVWDAGAAHPAPFARLQTRVTRKRVTPKLLQQNPAAFVAYDLLEWAGDDLRARPQGDRRARLEALFAASTASAGEGEGGGDLAPRRPAQVAPRPTSSAGESANAEAAPSSAALRDAAGRTSSSIVSASGPSPGGTEGPSDANDSPDPGPPRPILGTALDGGAGEVRPTTIASPVLRLSPAVTAPTWPALAALREDSRARQVEGFMLKRRDAQYGVGRTK
ncbi:MAG: ATP-dependent DNA ligase, partial [Burkholderiaceae bacterium]|nr:ATP-dependent DNA ligase [Burkholderiaceae bacterium]